MHARALAAAKRRLTLVKYWLSHLPLEVWVDVYRYPWITREELGQIVDRFCNRKYAEYLQFYLHDWGKRKLNLLFFDKGGLYKCVDHAPYRVNLDLPLTPMPGNIKFFERISIIHFDAQTMNFLRQIGPILSDVNLNVSGISPNNETNEKENLRIVLANLLPMLNGIHSLGFELHALPTIQQCFADKFANIKVLQIYGFGFELDEAAVQARADVLLKWLLPAQQDDSNGPRYCDAVLTSVFAKMFPAIRAEFLAAKTPRTFALHLDIDYCAWHQFVEFHLQNGIGEEMHGVKKQDGSAFRITRHLASRDKELHEWIGENTAQIYEGRIGIYKPTVGSIGGMDAPESVEEEDDHDKPCTSGKSSIA